MKLSESFQQAFRKNRDRILSRTGLDRFTSTERLLIIGLLTALIWGSAGIFFESLRPDKRMDSPGLYRELVSALPDRDHLISPGTESSRLTHLSRSASRVRETSAPETADQDSEVLETVPPRIYLTRPPTVRSQPGGVRPFEAGGTSPASRSRGKININRATKEELMKLPGIGPAFASRIIHYRRRHGGFASLMDLKKIKGIGEKRFQRIKDRVSLY